ncbi:AGAP010194-PA-like protein [Anopheles sinensis]|uniref:AGAP010194-PA-like protein n=1 Tax=Anopheles sinensis TaxID=74873 RepID=A0A084W640_ANOSI|nr:AGAP010194-PA-like protein [Anopheles sinensis]
MSLVQGKIKRKEWRKLCKKRRRKVVRQKAAKERDRLEEELQKEKDADPEYQKLLVEMLHQEEVAAGREALERALRNAQWLEEEHKAQQRFEQLRQQIETKEREEREKRERIRREFEERERRTEEARAERHRQQEEMVRLVRERHTKLQQFSATGIDDYLTELQMVHSTRADAVDCKFFTKTGTCRHGLRCSGNHPTPGLSKIILISNFFNHPALERTVHQEYGHDGRLEFDEEDLSNSFTDFFRDIVDEFERFGKIHQILVCRNFGLHLRGNVYIEYENMRHAAAAYLRMNGRFYAKKQLHVEFRSPIVWPAAVCGLFELKRCQKGPGCNFLHIFKNPDQRYQYDHFQQSRSMRKEASIVPATPLVLKYE